MTNQWYIYGPLKPVPEKAYDTVDHDLLLKKLSYYGEQGQTIATIL